MNVKLIAITPDADKTLIGERSMSCNQNCNQGCNCDCAPDPPVQYAAPDPDPEFGYDWVDWAIMGGTLAVVFVIGFGLGRALA